MYSYEDRVKAVKLYIQYDCSFSSVKHELGYPENRKTLRAWYQEFNKDGDLHERYTRAQKFTQEQRTEAEEHYYQHGRCISRTIQALGYPSRALLKQWLSEDHPEDFQHCSSDKPRVYLTQEQKAEAVQDLCTRTGSARSVADKYGVSPCSLYIWKKQFFSEGISTQMPKDNKQNEQKSEAEQIRELTSEAASLSAEAEDLRKQIYYLQMEKDALQMASEIIKKGRGITLDQLTNREKAVVIDALRNRYSLKDLLKLFCIAKSSYCYQEHSIKAPDKYEDARIQIRKSFADAYESYGYRRLHVCVRKSDGSSYSEKVIRRLVREENLVVKRS